MMASFGKWGCSEKLGDVQFRGRSIFRTPYFGMSQNPRFLSTVNFRLLRSPDRFSRYPSLETSLEPSIDIYENHLQKMCLELRYDRHFFPR